MAARYLLPALAIAGRAIAEVCSGTTTISNQAQATALATCDQFNGDIWIAPSTSGDIDISGIQRIQGSLIARKVPKMSSLTASTLSTISDTFLLDTISSLTSLNFPSLVAVDAIKWVGLPSLQGLSFTQQVQKANILNIQNTFLSTLYGIDLQYIETLYIANNRYLTDVSMQLGNATGGIVFSANGENLKVSFPNLEWAYNMTMANVSSLSIPSLAYTNGSAIFRSNYFNDFSAPNLTTVGGSLVFISNPYLSELSFPELSVVRGGLAIANNTRLTAIDGFPRLKYVFGAIDLYGTFKSAAIPMLARVQGTCYIFSSANIDKTCNHFENLGSGIIQGAVRCSGNIDSASTGGTGRGSGGDSGSSGSSGSNAGNSLLVPYATAVIGVVAAFFGML